MGDGRRGVGQRMALIFVAVLASSVAHADPAPDPTAIVVVLDRSSALHGERLEVAKLALVDLVESLPATDRVAIVAYAKRATVIAPMGAPSGDRIAKALDGLATDGSDANLESGLDLAATLFTDRRLPKRQVIVMSATEVHREASRGRTHVLAQGAAITTVAIQLDSHTRLDELDDRSPSYAVEDLIDLPTVLRRCVQVLPPRRDMAMVILIDRSGSMIEQDRMAAAVASANQIIAQLAPTDLVSVIAFGSDPFTIVPPTHAANRAAIANRLARLQPEGASHVSPALNEAEEQLGGINAALKQVFVISDGGVVADDMLDLIARMRMNDVTVSAVGVPGADHDVLSDIATAGNGELYMDSSAVRLVNPRAR